MKVTLRYTQKALYVLHEGVYYCSEYLPLQPDGRMRQIDAEKRQIIDPIQWRNCPQIEVGSITQAFELFKRAVEIYNSGWRDRLDAKNGARRALVEDFKSTILQGQIGGDINMRTINQSANIHHSPPQDIHSQLKEILLTLQ